MVTLRQGIERARDGRPTVSLAQVEHRVHDQILFPRPLRIVERAIVAMKSNSARVSTRENSCPLPKLTSNAKYHANGTWWVCGCSIHRVTQESWQATTRGDALEWALVGHSL